MSVNRHSQGVSCPPRLCLTTRRLCTSADRHRQPPRYTLAADSQARLPPGTTESPGKKIFEWFRSPFDVAAFGPRLTVGFLSKLTEPSKVVDDFQRVTDLFQSPSQYKVNLVASEIETIATDCLEKGAFVEADVFRQLKNMLPTDVAERIELPSPPSVSPPDRYNPMTAPISTSTKPVVTELPPDLDLK